MKTALKIIGFLLIFIFVIPSFRQKALNLIFPPKYGKGISYKELENASEKYKKEHGLPIKTFTSPNMKVNVFSIDEWSPKTSDNLLQAPYAHYLVVKASVENTSDSEAQTGMFNTTFFLEDDAGNLSHAKLENFVGYYTENNISPQEEVIDAYYTGKTPPHTALQPKLFFFPMRINSKAVKVHFDDWISKDQMKFNL